MRSRWVCHGASGKRQLELLREFLRDQQSLVAERRQRAGGAAELQRQPLAAQSPQPRARAMQGGGIFRELQAERHRQRMLQPGARDHRRVAMLPRQPGKACDGAIEIRQQRIDGGAQSQHGGGVDHVLAGGAPMHIARGLGVGPGDLGGERLDEGDGEIAGARRGLGQCRKIERFGLAGLRDRARRARGDDAGCRLGARQRCFEIEHVLEACHIVADGAHGGARQHGREQGREGGAHDARRPNHSRPPLPIPKLPILLRCEYASLVIGAAPFLLGRACFTWGQHRKSDREAHPWP